MPVNYNLLNHFKNDVARANNIQENQLTIRDESLCYPLYNVNNQEAGIGIKFITQPVWNQQKNNYEGGDFGIRAYAINNGRMEQIDVEHTCRRGVDRNRINEIDGYNYALITLSNAIMLQTDAITRSSNQLLAHEIISIGKLEGLLGIRNSPLRNNYYNLLINDLRDAINGIKNSGYQIIRGGSAAVSTGGLILNIFNIGLNNQEIEQVYSLFNNRQLKELTDEILRTRQLIDANGIDLMKNHLNEINKRLLRLPEYIEIDKSSAGMIPTEIFDEMRDGVITPEIQTNIPTEVYQPPEYLDPAINPAELADIMRLGFYQPEDEYFDKFNIEQRERLDGLLQNINQIILKPKIYMPYGRKEAPLADLINRIGAGNLKNSLFKTLKDQITLA